MQAKFRNKPEKEEWEGFCATSWTFASKALQWCSVVHSLSREVGRGAWTCERAVELVLGLQGFLLGYVPESEDAVPANANRSPG